eukprot:CAMPEP_0117483218 /NCGR_PEP_ID=MMETSP0784-20121206/13824_1 /TAXON_ID=39447 /ORGANISM="" /LENGTH=321 /DNA_ID=CAMNT_0005277743 /DNA_START=13 /DNA_END=978 /DNA_ORIENTATION=-
MATYSDNNVPYDRSKIIAYNENHFTSYNPSNSSPQFCQPVQNECAIFPRSASEALFDSTTKFRQLPCRTFISVGTCPYRERCVYLHDPRCICRDAKTKTRRKNKEDVVADALFWPVMPYSMVSSKLDNNRQPHVIQSYSVPLPQNDQYRRHDGAVYSMWMHFVDFCQANNEMHCAPYADAAACYSAPDAPINSYTGLPRLSVFTRLSRGISQAEPSYSGFNEVAHTSPGASVPMRSADPYYQSRTYIEISDRQYCEVESKEAEAIVGYGFHSRSNSFNSSDVTTNASGSSSPRSISPSGFDAQSKSVQLLEVVGVQESLVF